VKRNSEQFLEDFMFQLSDREFADLRSQFVTSSWGGSRRGIIKRRRIDAAKRRYYSQ
jgi:hypothetical protein